MPGMSFSSCTSISAAGSFFPLITRQTMTCPVARPSRINTWRIRPLPVVSSYGTMPCRFIQVLTIARTCSFTGPSQIAALCLNDAVGAPGIKSNADLAVPIPSDRELRLVPVAPGLFHTDHWLHGDIRKAADPAQMVLYFLSLES